jgi:5-bromo-4-chloroindolyl phosphate hydrolysis protein
MITLPSDSEDSLERLSTKRSEIHVADYREMRDRLEESRAYIQQLQKQLKDFNCNMR